MPKTCAIPGCTARVNKENCEDLSFYRLPKDPDVCSQWLDNIQRPISVSNHTRICSQHFVGGKKTCDVPIPTIFPWTKPNTTPHRKPPKERERIPPRPKKPKLEDTLKKDLQETSAELLKVNEKYDESERRVKDLIRENEQLRAERVERFGLQRFQGSDSDIRFYTGLPSYIVLVTVFNFLLPVLDQLRLYRPDVKVKNPSVTRSHAPRARALQHIDEFFLVLVRLRLGLLEMDLAHRFNVSVATISRIFVTWISFLDSQLRPLITWPSRTTIQNLTPPQFKKLYPNTRCIIDCTEIFTQTPSSLELQSATYSTYKHHNTFKGLVCISPNGAIIFVSPLFSGSVSNKQLTRLCGFLDFLEPGDGVLADKGFDITYDIMLRGAKLDIPPFLNKDTQLSKKQVLVTRRIASLRIHVERAIGCIKQYHILTNTVPLTLVPHLDHIWGVCCALTLFHPSLVPDGD